MAIHSFDEKLAYSRGVREATDIETIRSLIAGCESVRKTDLFDDRAGVDYIATLRRGAEVLIDAKTRTPGCSRHWRNGPELALEIWSVMPTEQSPDGKVGWTACEEKNVDYILFTFPPDDSMAVYLYPFQLLRMAFRENYNGWASAGYKTDVQKSTSQEMGAWQSKCIFVPEPVVWTAIRDVMQGQQASVE